MKVLISGGAGFIGSHVADELLRGGWHVRVLDSLDPQVHGEQRRRPEYLDPEVELIQGDVRDETAWARALKQVDAVVHFAAAVGVGQSMYEIARYTSVNNLGTAVLLEMLSQHAVDRLVVASSMSIYGEGAYRDEEGRLRAAVPRTRDRLRRGDWDVYDREGVPLLPVPTPEEKLAEPTSVYALSKYDQERLAMIVGHAYGIPTTVLRFFNVYGPQQAFSNPYTGVLTGFAARLLHRRPPLIFEDGQQQRDFVHVRDVARACRLALKSSVAAGEVLNIATGRPVTVLQVANELARVLGIRDVEPHITRQYRAGDIRHCFADISKAERLLDYTPRISFEEGMADLASWLEVRMTTDHSTVVRTEQQSRGLAV